MEKFGQPQESLAKTEIVSPIQNMRETKLIGKMRRIPGLKIWQLDLKTFEITLAEMDIQITFDGSTKAKLITAPGMIYCQALNKKNAFKKFQKQLKNHTTQ